ncbi:ATP-binding cassette domain-containing protein [Reichenbachiella sp. MALMAid0571]|uniref:ATP-binding cassette domain-containing protein n=1 Tax=Reichenbachiella sp. MALMAid0571 TaxID=3143939 RepID=UPI0032DF8FB3
MSESIINALMHLFAIIESVKDQVVDTGNMVVKPYLERRLNQELSERYLNLYQNYVDFYRRESKSVSEEKVMELETKNIIQVTKICNQLNSELVRYERTILFIQLIELINTDKKVSEKERDFIRLVALNFNISNEENVNIKSFILDPDIKKVSRNAALVIDNKMTEWPEDMALMMKNKKLPGSNDFKHIHEKNLFGTIVVLHIASVELFVCRYTGPLNLYLEGNKMVSGSNYILKPGAIIKGAQISPIYESEISKMFLLQEEKIKTVLVGENIKYQFKNSDNGIKPFSFYEESGTLLGIMGGSGSGKSTLINILSGKIIPDQGKIHINGHDIEECVEEGLIGFVPQDDLLFEELTVYENLYFNAELCFGKFSEEKIRDIIQKVLTDLDIAEIADLKVGDPLNKTISGGQRKRLNIGLELMREPSILYVDEPTSGLSSMDSEKVMKLLKEQSKKGKLVVVIIHQPSSDIFKLFDKLWILDRGGYPIYNGNPIDSVVYFKTMNTHVNAAESECRTCGNVITEQLLHIIESKEINEKGESTQKRKTPPSVWYEKYRENILPQLKPIKWQTQLPPSNFQIPKKLEQLSLFLRRTLLSKRSNKQYLILNLLEPPLLALILGYLSKYSVGSEYIFSENKNLAVYLFMSVVVALFMGLSVSAEEIFKDQKILVRESFLNLSRFSYLNSKIIYLFCLTGVQMFIFVLVGNHILEIEGLTFNYWLILFSAGCFANIIGLNISSGLNSIVTIYILIPLILVPQLLLGGAMIRFDELHTKIRNEHHVPLIGNVMVSRWAYEALAVEQYKNNYYERLFFNDDREISTNSYKASYLIPRLEQETNKALQYTQAKDSIPATYTFKLLSRELQLLNTESEKSPFNKFDRLNTTDFDSTVFKNVMGFLESQKEHYRNKMQQANEARESKYNETIKSIGKDELYSLKQNNHNKAIANLVLNRDVIEKIHLHNSRFIQKKDPIYMTPTSKWGNSQFYAPSKYIGTFEVDTFWFNIMAIWFLSLFFYFTLLFDLLKKSLQRITILIQATRRKSPSS